MTDICKVPWCGDDLTQPEEQATGWPICMSCMSNTVRRSMENEQPGSFHKGNMIRVAQWVKFIAENIDELIKFAKYPMDSLKLIYDEDDKE